MSKNIPGDARWLLWWITIHQKIRNWIFHYTAVSILSFNLLWQFYYNIQKIALNCTLIDPLQEEEKKMSTNYFIIASKKLSIRGSFLIPFMPWIKKKWLMGVLILATTGKKANYKLYLNTFVELYDKEFLIFKSYGSRVQKSSFRYYCHPCNLDKTVTWKHPHALARNQTTTISFLISSTTDMV